MKGATMPNPSAQRLDRIEVAIEKLAAATTTNVAKTFDAIDRLTNTTAALAESAERHDRQIDALIAISEQNAANWKNLERQWQAYLRRISRQ
jgi:chemotaxis regulatin CheY-phosphate phosphatase CheZ